MFTISLLKVLKNRKIHLNLDNMPFIQFLSEDICITVSENIVIYNNKVKTVLTDFNLEIVLSYLEPVAIKIHQFSQDILLEPINNRFAKGKLLNVDIIMLYEIGYINATKLCNDINPKKPFKDWNKNGQKNGFINTVLSNLKNDKNNEIHEKVTKNVLEEISSSEKTVTDTINILKNNIPQCESDLIIYVEDHIHLRGQYVHPYLIINIAQWCNDDFAFMITKIALDFIHKEAFEKQQAIIKKEKCKKVSLKKTVQELINKIDAQSSKIDILTDINKNIKEDISIAKDIVINKFVPNTPFKCKNHICILIKNRNYKYEYTMLRVMLQNRTDRLRGHSKLCKVFEIKKEINTPNAMNLWIRIKNNLIKQRYSEDINNIHFNLKNDYNYYDLERIILNIESEKEDIPLFIKYVDN